VLDDDQKQSIREWFRGFVRARSARGPSESETGRDEHAGLTRDLPLSSDLAGDVKGGSETRPEKPREP
jgi:hypothetical protein